MTVQWCDPPTLMGPWVTVLLPVMERPGQWALVREFSRRSQASGAARYLRNHPGARVPPGGWEFKHGPLVPDQPRFGVWARFLGEDQ